MLLNTCKKLNWTKHQQKMIKEEKAKRLEKMITKKHVKSYFLFKQKFIPAFRYVGESFNPKMYIKKGIQDNVVKVTKDIKYDIFYVEEIVLDKNILKNITINAATNRLIKTRNFYSLDDFIVEEELERILEDLYLAIGRNLIPQLLPNDIYFVLNSVYTPKNNKLFYNIDKAKEKIKLMSENNEVYYRLHVFLFSFALFFIEHIHDYFLKLLKNKSSIKIQMHNIQIESKGLFDISYYPQVISKKIFVSNTKVVSEEGITIKTIDKKIKEIIKKYKDHITKATNKPFNLRQNHTAWLILYSVAVNAFIVYTLAYLYHILDLEKIFDDLNHPVVPNFSVQVDTNVVVQDSTVFGLPPKSIIPKNSKLESIIMKVVDKELEKRNDILLFIEDRKHFFFTEKKELLTIKAKQHNRAMIEFLKQNKTNTEISSTFLLFTQFPSSNLCFILAPVSIPSFLLLYKFIFDKDNVSNDFIYMRAYNAFSKAS